MKKIFAIVAVLLFSFSLLAATSAEARRFGGGQSFGMRRAPMQQRPAYQAPQPARPAPAQASPAPAPIAAPARSGASRWLGPLAGLAAGAGLMALFSNMGGGMGGLGGGMGGILMMLLVAGAGFMIFSMLRRRSATASGPDYQPDSQYRGPYEVPSPAYQPSSTGYSSVPDVGEPAPVQAAYPADFDAPAFLRQAKVTFIRMQVANDAADLTDIRAYTTPEFYAEIAMQIQERGPAAQVTEVISIDAELLSVEVEDRWTIASIRYTGLVREEVGKAPESVNEIWHMAKDNAKGQWLVAGMQQEGGEPHP